MSLKEIRNADYTILLCQNLSETRSFYKNVMGFPLEADMETWVSFRAGATLLTLRPRGTNPVWDDGPAATGARGRPTEPRLRAKSVPKAM